MAAAHCTERSLAVLLSGLSLAVLMRCAVCSGHVAWDLPVAVAGHLLRLCSAKAAKHCITARRAQTGSPRRDVCVLHKWLVACHVLILPAGVCCLGALRAGYPTSECSHGWTAAVLLEPSRFCHHQLLLLLICADHAGIANPRTPTKGLGCYPLREARAL